MEYFAPDEAVERLELALSGLAGTARAAGLAALAWHLRQRDTRRSELLVDEAEARPDSVPVRGRLALVRAECALLFLRLDTARERAGAAAEIFSASGDRVGLGDAEIARARIAQVAGDRAGEHAHCAAAQAAYGARADTTRAGQVKIMSLLASGLSDSAAIAATIAGMRERGVPDAVECHVRHIEGILAFQHGRFADAIGHFSHAAGEAPRHGMKELRLNALASWAGALSNLGDRAASAEVGERALKEARDLGWPRAMAGALSHLGRLLMQMGEPARAIEVLEESAQLMKELASSRQYAVIRYFLGDAHLAAGNWQRALSELDAAADIYRTLGFVNEVAGMGALKAQALSHLGRVDAAVACASEALRTARETRARFWEAEALRTLAAIHARHAGADRSPRSALGLLREALAVVETLGGHHEKSELLAEMGRLHELAGDMPAALAAERAARAEQVQEQHRRAANQILVAQVTHDTERVRLEAEHQRSLAAAEAQRAGALQASLETLEQLRQAGQEITANLEVAGMVAALHHHLVRLADARYIGVYVFDAEGRSLRRYAVEHGKSLAPRDIPLADLESFAARCARERAEIYMPRPPGLPPAPGTEPMASLWFGPLLVGDRLLGVLTVQSPRHQAYGEREKLVFRALSGYAAVALANARIHGELAEQHRLLVETEAEMRRLATTDALTSLANRRHFFTTAQAEIERARRYGGAVGFALCDIDRFKAINDTHGHPAGDRVLATVARLLAAQQRPNDLVGRLGGEEFGVLLPGATLEATMAVAERIRAEVERLAIDWNGAPVPVTLSFGCAALADGRAGVGDAASTFEWLMQEADDALYAAKHAGRNRVQGMRNESDRGPVHVDA